MWSILGKGKGLRQSLSIRRLRSLKKFWTVTYQNISLKSHKMDDMITDARNIYEYSIFAVQPDKLIRNSVEIHTNKMYIKGKEFLINKNAYIVGFGKADLGMALALENLLQEHMISGVISIPSGMPTASLRCKLKNSKLNVFEGAMNNMPDEDSLLAANKITELVTSLEKSNLLFVLISGGGSALLPSPKFPLTLEEKQNVIKALASNGATIEELNVIRKKLSMLKGGGLAQLAKPAQVISLILSDIIGDPLGLIASGPTVKNTDDPTLPLFILEKYKIKHLLPKSALQLLESDKNNSNKDYENFDFVNNFVIGNNQLALNAASEKAKELHYTPVIMTDKLCGLACDVGEKIIQLVDAALQQKQSTVFHLCELMNIDKEKALEILDKTKILDASKGLCILFGGETTVQVKGQGTGGRNQELALACSLELYNKKFKNPIILLSAGTDGIDGPTDAAGALATPFIIDIANNTGIDAQSFLHDNNSYNFYKTLSSGLWHVKIGHTGTNVMDIIIILIKKNEYQML